MKAVMVQPVKKSKMQRNTAGFSLVELAIVLAILGLLAGGVLSTQSYLRGARQNTLISEGKFYLNAMKQFEQKYGGALPGDMGNATDYWSGTGNGDGNSMVGNLNSEFFLAFRHLQLAGLITGNYSGVAGSGGPGDADIGVNVPSLGMDGVSGHYFTPSATGYVSGDPTFFDGYYGTYFEIGKDTPNWVPSGGFLTPKEAHRLDTKYDDGIPGTGNLRALRLLSSCYASATAYAISDAPDVCNFLVSVP